MKKLVKLLYNKGETVNWASSSMIKMTNQENVLKVFKYLIIYGPTLPHLCVLVAYAGTLPSPVLPGTLQKLKNNETSYKRLKDG